MDFIGGLIMSNLSLKHSGRQKGFTLIEMSIVLVIIGLIIGGILKGQEIIESSRQKNLITQIDSTRAALTTFLERFNAMPGDLSNAQGTAAVARISTDTTNYRNGDGDGIVEPAAAAATAAGIVAVDSGANTSESQQFWVHLAGARLIDGVTPLPTATGYGDGNSAPAAPFPGAGLTVAYGTYADVAIDSRTATWVRVHRGTPAAPAAGLTPKQMFQLDGKTDDGLPAQGTFRSNLGGAGVCGSATAGTADYGASVESISCMAVIDLIQ